jgi:hypothetical protein
VARDARKKKKKRAHREITTTNNDDDDVSVFSRKVSEIRFLSSFFFCDACLLCSRRFFFLRKGRD